MHEPIATTLLLLAICGVSCWAWEDPRVESRLIFRPVNILADKQYYRLVTASFLHAGIWHLLANAYALYGFGGALEREFGPGRMLVVYFGGVVGGDLVSLYLHRFHDMAAYGASGGVCGLIFSYILAHPHTWMTIFPFPYAVPGWGWALAFLIASFYAMKAGRDNIGHDAHIGGAVIGLFIMALLNPALAREHWGVLFGLSGAGIGLFVYVWKNPLFLPISSFLDLSGWQEWLPRLNRSESKLSARKRPSAKPATASSWALDEVRAEAQSDWLLAEIEVHVGKLVADRTGQHDWVDKFGRNYDVIGGTAAHFDFASCTTALLDHLKTTQSGFVILDARCLTAAQVEQLRPWIADLPDSQFNRIIRSYGFSAH